MYRDGAVEVRKCSFVICLDKMIMLQLHPSILTADTTKPVANLWGHEAEGFLVISHRGGMAIGLER